MKVMALIPARLLKRSMTVCERTFKLKEADARSYGYKPEIAHVTDKFAALPTASTLGGVAPGLAKLKMWMAALCNRRSTCGPLV
ncbi:hypothetical protein ASC96_20645 [Rhizobium sp. Root1204]|nr:hypothetical protein ASC96_20645 [Rhizobium sp. Root1204]